MRVVVCVRQGLDGELGPFDACAYEAALRLDGAEVILLSMGPDSVEDFLLKLTRLGAQRAILLTDRSFSGSDTLATAYILSLAIKRLRPDLILCGRQTLEGDTAQVGPMLSVFAGCSLVTNVMELKQVFGGLVCSTRIAGEREVHLPALLTVERINTLRLPGLRSKLGKVERLDAAALGADPFRCGLAGSPTRVLHTFENQSGKRRCTFIEPGDLRAAIDEGLKKDRARVLPQNANGARLQRVFIVGDSPRGLAETVSDDITVICPEDTEQAVRLIHEHDPAAVLWGSDARSKELAAQTAARLSLGLCADCTALETDGQTLFMYRPALSGSVIAKIKSLTRPAMATVRTADSGVRDIIVAAGFGAREDIAGLRVLAGQLGAQLAASRRAVDQSVAPYEIQVGLTGRTVAPSVYLAFGISGAVHHIVGMRQAGTVIAVNPDRSAPIFDYADFGITAPTAAVLRALGIRI